MRAEEAREDIWEGGVIQARQNAAEAKSICGSFEPAVRVGSSRVKNALNERRWAGLALHGAFILASATFSVLLYLEPFFLGGGEHCRKQIAEEKSSRPAGEMILW